MDKKHLHITRILGLKKLLKQHGQDNNLKNRLFLPIKTKSEAKKEKNKTRPLKKKKWTESILKRTFIYIASNLTPPLNNCIG